MPEARRWQPGDVVIVRDVGSANALLWGRPYVVVQDSDDLIALFQPEGTKILRWHLEEQRFVEPHIAWMECLRLLFPGRPYDVTLVFETGTGVPPYWAAYFSGEGRFRGWKVNLQAPIRRTALGFDTTDEVLDIIVRPDRSWYWKDEQQLVEFVGRGVFTEAEAERIRQAGLEAVPLIEAAAPPFDDRWTAWHPPPDLKVGTMPDAWQDLPGGDVYLSTLNYERGHSGRRHNAWKSVWQ